MKKFTAALATFLCLPYTSLHAAAQPYPVRYRQAVYQDGHLSYESQRQTLDFRVELISDSEGLKMEELRGGRSFVTAQPEERYAVRLYNPLPVRVAANLTVDGLNSISGKPSGISDGQKWMIDPYSWITIRGWQVNGSEARRFFFTEKPKSYAKWTGDRLGKDLARNCGVIGAAFFWSQQELDHYYAQNPIYRYSRSTSQPCKMPAVARGGVALGAMDNVMEPRADFGERKEKAGTGMGERVSHPTLQVAFNYDRGMYRTSQAVLIYYDFAPAPTPDPFPSINYAPEM